MHALRLPVLVAGAIALASSAAAQSSPLADRTPLLSETDRLAPIEAPRLDLLPPAKSSPPRPTLSFRLVFFPPVAPPFEAPIAETARVPRINGVPIDAPIELADYVGENFYAPLSTRLWEDSLSKAEARRLEAYTATRDALVRELRNELETLQLADAATREARLRDLARVQSPLIATLEEEAEQLRRDLLRGRLLEFSIDWNASRVWRLGEIKAGNPLIAGSGEQQVMRAAAYYQDGLGVEQRWLLREIAMELHEELLAKTGRPRSNDTTFAMFFSPATGRFRLPEKISAELKSIIGAYNGERRALKTELRETVFRLDAEKSEQKRIAALEELSERQWPRLVALEEKAEIIRRALDALPPPPLPRLPPPIPKEIIASIDAFVQDKRAFEAERRAQPRKIGTMPLLVEGPLNGSLEERRQTMQRAIENREARRQEALAAFDRENAARRAELQARAEKIEQTLDAFAATWVDPHTGKSTDATTILRSFQQANRAFAAVGRRETIYREYGIAQLQPGLSPAQRRLLFAAVVTGLAQPLPGGEAVPQRSQRQPSIRL